jgi:Flp pilus assembly protein TadG
VSGDRPRRPILGAWLREDGGAAAVEFALVLPAMLVCLVGLVQVGWALHCGSSVRWALESSARQLLLNPGTTADQLKTAMTDKLQTIADPNNLTVTVTSGSSNGAPVLQASSRYVYDLQILFLPSQQLTFTAATTVPIS